MKIIPIIFLIMFVFSFIGIAVFPSVAMVVCGEKTNMCQKAFYQLEKAAGFFIGIFSINIYFSIILVLFFFINVSLFLENNNIRFYLKRKIISFNNVFFDYLKILFSRGVLKSKLYY